MGRKKRDLVLNSFLPLIIQREKNLEKLIYQCHYPRYLTLQERRKLSDTKKSLQFCFLSLNESVKIESRRISLTLNSYSFSFLFPLTVAWVTLCFY